MADYGPGKAYVYYSYEQWGRGYIGARGRDPVDDIYFGSFKDTTFEPTEKIVLEVFDTMEEALEAEVLLHEFFDVAVNPHFANRAKQTSKGFTTMGIPGFFKGRHLYPETRRKIAESLMGKSYLTESGRERIREAMSSRRVSKETGERIRKIKRTPISFVNDDGGLFFDAKADAALFFEVTPSAISQAIKSKKFRGYRVLV